MQTEANLVLRFKTVDGPRWEMRRVMRLRLDGHGRMILWDAATGEAERIEMARVEALRIEPISRSRKAA